MSRHAAPIVIVEDDDSLRRAVERVLQAAGYATTAFAAGEDLLATLAAQGAGCLVFDINLPGRSGLEVYADLHAAGIHVPVVFITAHDSLTVREAALRAGALAYLLKPFASRDLLAAIAAAYSGPFPPGQPSVTP